MDTPHLAALWRYPVKSMAGEALTRAPLIGGQLEGDRAFGVIDVATGALLSAKRVAPLLAARARWIAGVTTVELPGGFVGAAGEPGTDAALSAYLGRAVALRPATPGVRATIEMELVADDGGDGGLDSFQTQPGSLFDSRSPLHLCTTATARQLEAEHGAAAGALARYRPNLVVDGTAALAELAWVERRVRLGAVTAWVRTRTERCVVVTRAQGALAEDRRLLRHLATRHAASVGIYLHPDGDGVLAVGDVVVPVLS